MKKILVVDDQQPVRHLLRLLFENKSKHKYSVVEAENGQEALKKLVEEEPDVAIVDLMMPHVDGFTLLNEIKLANNYIPVIILTAMTDDATVQKVKTNYPEYKLVLKPADNNELYALVEAALKQ